MLRHINIQGFKATIFRKNASQIFVDGGLLDESRKMYAMIQGIAYRAGPYPRWIFGSGASLTFRHIEADRDLPKWQGSQICMIGFDELTHFSSSMFFYMLSRNRSTCGVKPYVRATCNPDADSWVKDFISWWLDDDTGYPIEERSGIIRYMIRLDGKTHWGDDREELAKKFGMGAELCKSVTFIASSVYDNKELLKVNPQYLASLNALNVVEKERLLKGNWKIRPAAGLYFSRGKVRVVKMIPDKIISIVRAWDLAATEITESNKSPDRTAGVLMARLRNGQFIVLDVIRRAYNSADVRNLIRATAKTDIGEYRCHDIRIPQDPGQAGKEQAKSYLKELAGYNVKSVPVSGSKITRAEPLSAQWMGGNVLLLEGAWNEEYFLEMEGFPDAAHDDMVDASSDAFAAVSNMTSWRALAH